MALPTQNLGTHPGSDRVFRSGCGAGRLTDFLLDTLSADKAEFGDFYGFLGLKIFFFTSSKNCLSHLTKLQQNVRKSLPS